ncbi:MAG TPA: 2-oxo-4-hydroxy-4-carboxy-5-ureidoimidazoline decarboxylase [Phycisphaerae bacterium]|nr:2-oxo-4-hydroxy-4-carboxy-5-ureidoimidazoline decarboxylase [Phycisphaerae bacterium]
MIALAALNALDRAGFTAAVGHVFEHSSWIAERVWRERQACGRKPFESVEELHAAMMQIVHAASEEERLGLLRAHPDLVGRLAREGRLTAESTAEQRAAGLGAVSADEAAAFERYNAAYREKFGFPFIVCARENRKEAILAAFLVRLQNGWEVEMAAALAEVAKIAMLRLRDTVR